MAIKFRTNTPDALLARFKKLINQREAEGKINTWEEHEGGFRHTSAQWKDRGRFAASLSDDGEFLVFTMTKVADDYAFAYYHGHLLQTFIEHLGPNFLFSRYNDGRKK